MTIREVVKWRRLAHPNIAPFHGITLEPLQFVLTWVPGVSLGEYITLNQDANRLDLVGVQSSSLVSGFAYIVQS
jgi:hypothetical protein